MIIGPLCNFTILLINYMHAWLIYEFPRGVLSYKYALI